MARPRRLISPALFAAAAMCFLLPFASVSCQGPAATKEGLGPGSATQTGFQMATGTGPTLEVHPGVLETLGEDRRIFDRDPEPLAAVAFASGLLGIAVSIGTGRLWRVASAALAVAAVAVLVMLRAELQSDLTAFGRLLGFEPDEVDEAFALQYRAGYWLALTAFASAVLSVAAPLLLRPWGAASSRRRSPA
jgi:hypothetical protein